MSKRQIMLVTIALLLSNAMSGIDNTIINTALPAIISDLHGLELMAWIIAIFLLGTAVSTLIWSKLGERIGNKRSYQLAAVLFVFGSFLQGLSPNIWFLIFARGLSGLGNGGMISLPYIIYVDLYKNPRQRMKALAFVSASYSMATIIGPLLGGFIVDSFSWHWVFYINVPIGLISAFMVQIFYKEKRLKKVQSTIDYLGGGLMIFGLIALLCGIELIGAASPVLIIALIVVAIAAFIALFQAEQHAADPVIPSRLFKNKPLVMDFALFVLIWGAFVAFLTYSPMWAQGLIGTSALIGGATQIPCAFANFSGSEAVPWLRRFYTPHKVINIGIITLALSFVILVLLGVKTPFAYVILLIAGVFEGFGNGACFNELQVKVQEDAGHDDVSVATSFSFLIRMLSQMFTTAIFGLLMNHALAKGVSASHGVITMAMMNKLSDADSVSSLPQHLLPQMRLILHSGLHNIMLLSLGLMVVSFLLNLRAQRAEKNIEKASV